MSSLSEEQSILSRQTIQNDFFFSELCPFLSSPEYEVLRVSYCDHSSVGVRRLSVVLSHFLVYSLASTNINQSAPNLVKMYVIIRSQMIR